MAQYHRMPHKQDEGELVDAADRALHWMAVRWRLLLMAFIVLLVGTGLISWQRYRGTLQAAAASEAYFLATKDDATNLEGLQQVARAYPQSFLGQMSAFALAKEAMEREAPAEARTHLEPLLHARTLPPLVDLSARDWIAHSYAAEGQWDEAAKLWQALLQLDTEALLDQPALLQKTVLAWRRAGKTDAADALLMRSNSEENDSLHQTKETQRLWLSIAASH